MDIYQNICSLAHNQIKKGRGLVSQAALNNVIFQNQLPMLIGNHVKEINSLLNNGKTREQGVALLLDLVGQCTQETLSEQGERWFRLCSQAVNSVNRGQAKANACQVLIHILRDPRVSPELHRAITSKSPAPLILTLAAADPSWNCTGLECLWEYLKTAPGQCLPYRSGIEAQVLQYLDNPIPSVGLDGGVLWAGQVYAVLPLPGRVGPKAQGHAEARSQHLTALLALAHSLMDNLLDGIIEKESFEHTREHRLTLPPLEDDEDPTTTHLAVVTRLVNTVSFIAEFITNEANSSLIILPQDLLSVIFRILQVETSVLRKYRSQEHKLVAFMMPTLHQRFLSLLHDILQSVGESVDQYWGPMTDLLTMVARSYGGEGGQATRVVAYSVLDTLLQVSEGCHAPPPTLVSHIITDITPKAHHIKLQKGKNLSLLSTKTKGNKKKGFKSVAAKSSSVPELLPLLVNQLCHTAWVALKLTKSTLTHAAYSLDTKTHQQLQSALVSVAGSVAGMASTRLPDLYTCPQTRAALFTALAALATSPSRRWPAPYTLLMDLLRAGMADENTEVGSACQVALANVSFTLANPQVCALSQAYQFHNHNTIEEAEEEDDVELENGRLSPESATAEEMEEDAGMEDEEEENEPEEFEEGGGVEEDKEEDNEVELVEEEDSEVELVEEETGKETSAPCQDNQEEEEPGNEEETQDEVVNEPMSSTVGGGEGEHKSEAATKPATKRERPVASDSPEPSAKKKKKKKKTVEMKETAEKMESAEKAETTEKVEITEKAESAEKQMGPSIEEMISTFVDADPDD